MREIRQSILSGFQEPAPGNVRPAQAEAPAAAGAWPHNYWTTATHALRFLKAQWAGALPEGYDVAWREPGFVGACGGSADGGSFATGGARFLPRAA